MKDSATRQDGAMWKVPPARWLAEYSAAWLRGDIIAGVTLAAYAIPVSLAYAGLAGLPPQVGVYGYLLGGLGYALLGSSRQLAIRPPPFRSWLPVLSGKWPVETHSTMRRSPASPALRWRYFV